MYKYKNLIIILLISISFSQKERVQSYNHDGAIKTWEDEDRKTDNPEFKTILEKKNDEYELEEKMQLFGKAKTAVETKYEYIKNSHLIVSI